MSFRGDQKCYESVLNWISSLLSFHWSSLSDIWFYVTVARETTCWPWLRPRWHWQRFWSWRRHPVGLWRAWSLRAAPIVEKGGWSKLFRCSEMLICQITSPCKTKDGVEGYKVTMTVDSPTLVSGQRSGDWSCWCNIIDNCRYFKKKPTNIPHTLQHHSLIVGGCHWQHYIIIDYIVWVVCGKLTRMWKCSFKFIFWLVWCQRTSAACLWGHCWNYPNHFLF